VHTVILSLSLPEEKILTLAKDLAAGPTRPVIVISTIDARIPATSWQAHHIIECLTKPVRTRALHQALVCALTGSTPTRDQTGAMLPAAKTNDGAGNGSVIHALLVEDHLVNQRIARLFLQKLGCTVHLASNGREAISRLAASTYDVIFMDCQMPEMDGFEAARLIRANEAHGIWRERQPAFIVAMTANAMQGDRERCIAAGMDDYIAKPFTPEAVQRVLRRVRTGTNALASSGNGADDA
jgi:CheY-like chemotaxis protein